MDFAVVAAGVLTRVLWRVAGGDTRDTNRATPEANPRRALHPPTELQTPRCKRLPGRPLAGLAGFPDFPLPIRESSYSYRSAPSADRELQICGASLTRVPGARRPGETERW